MWPSLIFQATCLLPYLECAPVAGAAGNSCEFVPCRRAPGPGRSNCPSLHLASSAVYCECSEGSTLICTEIPSSLVMAPPPEPHSGKHHAYICPVTTRGCCQTTVFLSLLIISCIHRSVKRTFKLLTSIINSLSLLLSLSLSPPLPLSRVHMQHDRAGGTACRWLNKERFNIHSWIPSSTYWRPHCILF